MEDVNPLARNYRLLASSADIFTFFFLRDPANWLASGIRHGKHTIRTLKKNKDTLKVYLNIALHNVQWTTPWADISYNRFCQEPEYRKKLADRFELFDLAYAELALNQTANFGGGSSFGDKERKSGSQLDRFLEYLDDKTFQSILNDQELYELSSAYFGEVPGTLVIRDIIDHRKLA